MSCLVSQVLVRTQSLLLALVSVLGVSQLCQNRSKASNSPPLSEDGVEMLGVEAKFIRAVGGWPGAL